MFTDTVPPLSPRISKARKKLTSDENRNFSGEFYLTFKVRGMKRKETFYLKKTTV